MSDAPQSPIRQSSNRFRTRPLRTAALAVTATAASTLLAREADAAIIYDLSNSYSAGDSLMIDGLDSGEIQIVAQTMGGMLSLSLEGAAGMTPTSTVEFVFYDGGMMTDYLDGLSVADTVDAALTASTTGTAFLLRNDTINPDFPAGTPVYAGFVFNPSGGLPLYGWIQLEINGAGDDVTLSQWAYDSLGNDLGVSIIPEPGTSLLLGLGLAGLAATMRRPRGGKTLRALRAAERS